MIRKGEEIIAAVIGPSKCGKTTLARALVSKMWRQHKLRSIVYDPWLKKYGNTWGKSAWVTDDLDRYKKAVWGTSRCCVIWDESTDSLNRNDRSDQAFFSRIRHEHPAFFLLAHDIKVMNPVMRGNLSDLFIFRQGVLRSKFYAEDFADAELLQTAELQKYEFIHKRPMEPMQRMKPTPSELQNL